MAPRATSLYIVFTAICFVDAYYFKIRWTSLNQYNNWQAAREACQNWGADLATFSETSDIAKMIELCTPRKCFGIDSECSSPSQIFANPWQNQQCFIGVDYDFKLIDDRRFDDFFWVEAPAAGSCGCVRSVQQEAKIYACPCGGGGQQPFEAICEKNRLAQAPEARSVYDHNGNPQTLISAGNIACGDTVTGSRNAYQVKYYNFISDATYGEVYGESCSSLHDTYLYLFDANGRMIYDADDQQAHENVCSNGFTGDITITNTVPAWNQPPPPVTVEVGDLYFIGVGGFSSRNGDYTLKLVCNAPSAAKVNNEHVIDGYSALSTATFSSSTQYRWTAYIIIVLLIMNVVVMCFFHCKKEQLDVVSKIEQYDAEV